MKADAAPVVRHAIVLACLAVATCADPGGPLGMTFQATGCAQSATAGQQAATVRSAWRDGRLVVDVTDADVCGLRVRRPTATLRGDEILLAYDLVASGDVGKCYCDYTSRFTLSRLAAPPAAIRFAKTHSDSLF